MYPPGLVRTNFPHVSGEHAIEAALRQSVGLGQVVRPLNEVRREAWLEGFTVSEFDPAKLFTAAIVDQARKHRKRPPDEARRIEDHRKTRSR